MIRIPYYISHRIPKRNVVSLFIQLILPFLCQFILPSFHQMGTDHHGICACGLFLAGSVYVCSFGISADDQIITLCCVFTSNLKLHPGPVMHINRMAHGSGCLCFSYSRDVRLVCMYICNFSVCSIDRQFIALRSGNLFDIILSQN